MQSRRSRAREVVLQLLFQSDQNPKPMTRDAVRAFVDDRIHDDAEAAAFALNLFDGVHQQKDAIDAMLAATATNWKLHRMLPVDRNVLRLATYELRFAPEPTPAAAAINEAIELSRRFGSLDSPTFVNGILDTIANAPA